MMKNYFELVQMPFVQVLFFILLTILYLFINRPKSADNTWVRAGYVFIVFMLVNSILVCTVANSWTYLFYSLGFSVLYLVSMPFILSVIIKVLKIEGSAESAMIFIFIIYHPVLLLLMMFLKWGYVNLW